MGRQKFGETKQYRGVSWLQLKEKSAQLVVIVLKPFYEPVLTGLNQQRQHGVFLDDKMRIELGVKSSKAAYRHRFDCHRIT